MMFNKNKLVFAVSLLFSMTVTAAEPQKVTGLQSPESVVVGSDGRLYVSEIGEFGKDGDGKVSVIAQDGKVQTFAMGMDDPKGLAFFGNDLYVADKTRVLKVGIDGKWTVLAAADAFPVVPQFLNDVEADSQGNVYVSDSGDLKGKGGAIYRINKNGKVTRVVGDHDPQVQGPNGLLMDGRGALLEVDFVSGILYRVKLRTGEMEKIAEGFGGGDGVVRGPGGVLYVSDWKNGKVYSVSKKGKVELFKDGFQAAADLGKSQDGKYVLVPDMKAGELVWLPVK
ncbi:gluconolaconase [Methylobacillus sp. MM3]|uniref:SMP-30/gluconolactonase/LRE family protein n=1 Tax=Methylobacillus sp. MM3 TaxID=1848039 RepID=UPI0007E2639C|nr:SMP-30/gluconolactonase/LRE family protein [Methylobacillus sp. MM3]OAJ71023.1 gluconolaconase [Methylobacillus sp. MM3]